MRTLLRLKLCYEYLTQKCDYATLLSVQKRNAGQLLPEDLVNTCLKNAVTEKMTYLYKNKGLEMEPTISAQETLFVRKLPHINLWHVPQQIHVGDVVVLKDPLDSDNYVVRRLAAVNKSEMVSTNEEDEPFVLEDGQCWVLSDNKNLKPGENKDSRTYGPISITDIVGRVIYRFRTLDEHGFVMNSRVSMRKDRSLALVELDYAEMLRMQCHNDEESKDSQT